MSKESFGTTDNEVPAGTSPEAAAAAIQPVVTSAEFELKVGERTFNSKESVGEHITHSQTHIASLEAENKQLRESQVSLEQKVGEVDVIKEQVQTLLTEVQKNQHSDSPASTGTTDVNTLVAAVKESISADGVATNESKNWNDSSAAAKALWGDDYLGKIQSKADELGMSIAEVDRLAKKSPKAFKQMVLGVAPQKNGNAAPTESSVSASALQASQGADEGKPMKFTTASTKDRAADVARRITEKESQQ